jgi:hypothetical protein
MENRLKVLVTDSKGEVLIKFDDLDDVHLIVTGERGVSITHSMDGSNTVERHASMLKYIQISKAHIKDLLKRNKSLRCACRRFKSEERKIYKTLRQEIATVHKPYKAPFGEYEET